MNIDGYLSILSQYKYISFDLYDTLIFRCFSNVRFLYNYVEYLYNYRNEIKIKGFAKKRIKAEICARKKTSKEITMYDIYSNMKYSDSIKNKLIEIENMVEIKNTVKNSFMTELIKKLKNQGSKIVITTDIFLDEDSIKKILEKNEIYYDYLFVSSKLKFTKSSGKLYEYIKKVLDCDSDDICHIGDNRFSDILMPKNYNIASFYQNNYPIKDTHSNCFDDYTSAMKYYYLKNNNNINVGCFEIGYTKIGPFLYDFCKWINEKKKNENIDEILFLAREGYLIKKCYDLMYSSDKTSYFMLNKNLLRFPIIYVDKSFDSFRSTLPKRNGYKVYEICRYFNVDFSYLEDKNIIRELKLSYDSFLPINGHEIGALYSRLVESLWAEIEEQYKLFEKYIVSNFLNKSILLVNNSIDGNGQILLNKILSKIGVETSIVGCQFVMSNRCISLLPKKCFGYFNEKYYGYNISSFERFTLLLEHLMFENNGTSLRFKTNGVECDKMKKEKYNSELISEIQKYSIDFVLENTKMLGMSNCKNTISNMFDLFRNPSFNSATIISNLYDDDYEGSYRMIDSTPIIGYCRFRNIKIFKRAFKSNRLIWRQGYMVVEGINPKFLRLYNYFEVRKDIKRFKKNRVKKNV